MPRPLRSPPAAQHPGDREAPRHAPEATLFHDHRRFLPATQEQRLAWATLLVVVFMVVEVAGAWISGSLALLSDAAHMAMDAVALAMAWIGLRLARRPADWQRTYGYARLPVLAAFANGMTLIPLILWILVEALRRLLAPTEVQGATVTAIASIGLIVNLVMYWLLTTQGREGGHAHPGQDLNMRAAALHVLGDLLGSVAAIAAGLIILATGWTPIDPLLSLLVALVLSHGMLRILRESGQILMESAPPGLAVEEISDTLRREVPDLTGLHHLHVWMLTELDVLVTLHAECARGTDINRLMRQIRSVLHDRFGLDHVTIQAEWSDGPDPDEPAAAG